jgi:hypothetical protein
MTNRAKEIEKKIKAVAAVDDANDQIKEVGLAAVTGWGNGMLCVMVRYNPDTMQFEPYTGTELETAAVEVEVDTDTLESLTQTLIDQGKYQFRNIDVSDDPLYVGHEASDGSWEIMEYTAATGVGLYATGSSGYAAAWIARAAQSYS